MASVPGSSGYGGRDARSLQVVLGCGVDGVADDSLAAKLCPDSTVRHFYFLESRNRLPNLEERLNELA